MKKTALFALVLVFSTIGCQKDVAKIYDINRQKVELAAIDKNALKGQITFISNAHADLFGKPIEGWFLNQTLRNLASSNDKDLVTDLVLRQMLGRADLPVSSAAEMRGDPEGFILATYKKFYRREPNPFEKLKLRQIIETETALEPIEVFYAFLTSEEYAFN